MSDSMKCLMYVIPYLEELNREFERPLSVLLINALEVDLVAKWEPWVRRVAIFADTHPTYYHLVATATGTDLYSRFNYKMRVGTLSEVSSSDEITWPFDVIHVKVNEDSWISGMREKEVWKEFFSKQIGSVEKFLLIVQGAPSYVEEAEKLLRQVEREMQQPFVITNLRFQTFRSDGNPSACCIWNVGNRPTRVRPETTAEEHNAVTETLLWGDES